jgi:hypothetical protein
MLNIHHLYIRSNTYISRNALNALLAYQEPNPAARKKRVPVTDSRSQAGQIRNNPGDWERFTSRGDGQLPRPCMNLPGNRAEAATLPSFSFHGVGGDFG